MNNDDKCQWTHCRGPADVEYLSRWVCWKHWDKICALTDAGRRDEVHRILKIKRKVEK